MPTYSQDPKTVASDLAKQAQSLGVPNVSQYIQQDPITSASLAPSPTMKIPENTAAPSEANGFSGYLEQLSKNASTAEKEKNTSLQSYLDAQLSTQGEQALTADAYKTGGVDTLDLELKDLNAQLLGEQNALKNDLLAIEKNPEGLTVGALKDRMDDARTASLRRQADIAILQSAKQGQFDSARAIADRAVNIQLEKDKQRQDALQLIYNENKELFTTREKRAFEAAQADRQRELDNKEYRLRAEYDAKIKQSDPLYQAQVAQANANIAKTYSDMRSSGGSGLLSVSEAQALGVPYGTTKAQAIGAIPTKPLTPSQKDDVATMDTVVSIANSVSALGERIEWKGVGGFGSGSVNQFFAKNFGAGTSEQQDLRNNIGNIQGTIAKLRGGTSFTPNEQALLETYVPTINDSPIVIKSKLNQLINYVNTKKSLLISPIQTTSNTSDVLRSPDGTQEVSVSDLSPAQLQEAKDAGWQ